MKVVRPPRRWAPFLSMADLEEKGRIEAFFYIIGIFAVYLSVVALAMQISFALNPPYSGPDGQVVNPSRDVYDGIYRDWVLGVGVGLSLATVVVFFLSRTRPVRMLHIRRFVRKLERRALLSVFIDSLMKGTDDRFFRAHNLRSWNREFIKQSIRAQVIDRAP